MLIKRKVWIGVSLLASAGVVAAAADTGGDIPGGKFSDALRKVLAGEGGESGIGMSKLRNGSASVPALKGAHVKEALTGNTLRRDGEFALHFTARGTFYGWEVRWDKVDASRCTKDAGDQYWPDKNGCWFGNTIQQPEGSWSIEGDALCTKPALITAAQGNRCVSLALVLDRVAIFNDKGDMLGKPNALVAGERLDRSLKNK